MRYPPSPNGTAIPLFQPRNQANPISPTVPHPPNPLGKKLLLIGWDSADRKIIRPLIDGEELPVLARLLRNGTNGNLTTIEPVLSPMLWTSIATGTQSYLIRPEVQGWPPSLLGFHRYQVVRLQP